MPDSPVSAAWSRSRVGLPGPQRARPRRRLDLESAVRPAPRSWRAWARRRPSTYAAPRRSATSRGGSRPSTSTTPPTPASPASLGSHSHGRAPRPPLRRRDRGHDPASGTPAACGWSRPSRCVSGAGVRRRASWCDPSSTLPTTSASMPTRSPTRWPSAPGCAPRTCVFPWCSRTARRCDLDHGVPWPHGPTADDNLAPLCRFHHRLKTHGGWIYTRLDETSLLWRSPHGLRFLRDHTGTRDVSVGRPVEPPDLRPRPTPCQHTPGGAVGVCVTRKPSPPVTSRRW